jgi:hypothetical protein
MSRIAGINPLPHLSMGGGYEAIRVFDAGASESNAPKREGLRERPEWLEP